MLGYLTENVLTKLPYSVPICQSHPIDGLASDITILLRHLSEMMKQADSYCFEACGKLPG